MADKSKHPKGVKGPRGGLFTPGGFCIKPSTPAERRASAYRNVGKPRKGPPEK